MLEKSKSRAAAALVVAAKLLEEEDNEQSLSHSSTSRRQARMAVSQTIARPIALTDLSTSSFFFVYALAIRQSRRRR